MTLQLPAMHCPLCRSPCPSGGEHKPVWDCTACKITFRVSVVQVAEAARRRAAAGELAAQVAAATVKPDKAYFDG